MSDALAKVRELVAARKAAAEKAAKENGGSATGDLNALLLARLKPVEFKPVIPVIGGVGSGGVGIAPPPALVPARGGFMASIGGGKGANVRGKVPEEETFPEIGEEDPEERFVAKRSSANSPGVTRSAEFQRIAALPRRPWGGKGVPDLTDEFKKPGGKFTLREVQSWGIYEMRRNGGALIAAGAGHGKTLMALLAAAAMNSPRTVILVPPQVKDQMLTKDIPNYFQHFKLPLDKFQVVSYSELSNAKTADVLHRLQPELIVADECFPCETQVITDEGPLPIGDIVQSHKGTFALSKNLVGKLEWKRIVRRMPKNASKLVKVTHTSGSFECTPQHKIWTENRGYVRADELKDSDYLCTLQQASRGALAEKQDIEVLLAQMPAAGQLPLRQEGHSCRVTEELCDAGALSLVHEAPIHSAYGQDPEDAVLRRCSRTVLPKIQGRVEGRDPSAEGHEEGAEQEAAPNLCGVQEAIHQREVLSREDVQREMPPSQREQAHGGKESYGSSRRCGEDEGEQQGQNLSCAGRKLAANRAATAVGGDVEFADGVSDSYGPREGSVRVAASLLQGGPGDPFPSDSDRGRRKQPQFSQVEILGPSKRNSTARSRVVHVEISERTRSDSTPGCLANDIPVFDLEIEDNHNYFAEGVLVSNCHLLRNAGAARSKRFVRYFKDYPKTRFVGLSGTITRKSIKDYAHLSELALKDKSPLPLRKHFHELMDWAGALDVSDDPLEPGALLDFCDENEKRIISTANPRDPEDRVRAQKAIRDGYRRRLVETPGIVATEEGAIGTSLIITGLYPKVPADVEYAIKKLRATWEISDDELTDAAAVARVARQLAMGFYYRWVWPDGRKNKEWLQARSDWNKEVRGFLKRSRPGLDSPMLVAKAAARGEIKTQFWHAWAEEPIGGEVTVKGKTRPRVMKDIAPPPVETVWIDDYLVKETAKWCSHVKKSAPAIVWYEQVGFGEALAKLTGLPFYGSGEEASKTIINVDAQKTPCIIASRIAHGTGKNLQQFSRCLFTSPPPGAVDNEQTLARIHRPGQEADTVEADYFLHTAEMLAAFQSALSQAAYIETTQGQKQKLLYATKRNCGD